MFVSKKIAIISSSVREGRLSHRVALFLEKFVSGQDASVNMLDLQAYDFPLFHERDFKLDNPSPQVQDFADKIKAADGIIVVSPV